MSTKLTHFGLTWNLSNNSKIVGNQKKLQFQKLLPITPSFSTFFWEFSSSLSYFPGDISISAVYLRDGKIESDGPLVSDRSLRLGPPVGGRMARRCHTPF
jgi:hypothetical protein